MQLLLAQQLQTNELRNNVVSSYIIGSDEKIDTNLINGKNGNIWNLQKPNVDEKVQTWNLVWQDEYEVASINSNKWTFDLGTGTNGWGNNELQYYTNRPANVTVANGNLLIIARKESYAGREYTSARLKTQGLYSFKYGKIEARIKVPMGQGLWPAFWMLGANITTVGWPKCGEIDIMEHINKENKIYGTMHWDYNGHAYYGGSVSCDPSLFHIYSVEWDSKAIKWFIDGSKYWEGNITNNINGTEEFHLPFFIVLNLAVGGNWPGSPDGTTVFPDTLFVDYVRVYQAATDIKSEYYNQNPEHFNLLQNYPNPFNPTTIIKYDVPNVGSRHAVNLRVYNILGKEVATLVDEQKPAGSYEIKFNASHLPSGVYFYRMIAGQFADTKKLILIK